MPGDVAWSHYALCEDAARTMVDRSTTILTQAIGLAVLRNLGVATRADAERRQRLDWLQARLNDASSRPGFEAALGRLETALLAGTDEAASLTNLLSDVGLPPDPPAGWTRDTTAPFAAISSSAD